MTVYHAEKDKQAWLAERKLGIGGSEASAVLGFDQYKTRGDVYIDKISEETEEIDNGYTWLGTVLEEPIARRYCEVTGRQMRRQPLRVCSDYPYMRCSIDRQIVNDDRGAGVWECKTASPYLFDEFKAGGLPEKYIIQLQHNIAVCGYTWGAICVVNRDNGEMIYFDVDRDDALIEIIRKELGLFWHGNIVPRIIPELATEPRIELHKLGGERVEITGTEWQDACEKYAYAKKQADVAKAIMNEAKVAIVEQMEKSNATKSTGAGFNFSRSVTSGRLKTDLKLLQAQNPNINIGDYQTQGNDFVTLRATQRKV